MCLTVISFRRLHFPCFQRTIVSSMSHVHPRKFLVGRVDSRASLTHYYANEMSNNTRYACDWQAPWFIESPMRPRGYRWCHMPLHRCATQCPGGRCFRSPYFSTGKSRWVREDIPRQNQPPRRAARHRLYSRNNCGGKMNPLMVAVKGVSRNVPRLRGDSIIMAFYILFLFT